MIALSKKRQLELISFYAASSFHTLGRFVIYVFHSPHRCSPNLVLLRAISYCQKPVVYWKIIFYDHCCNGVLWQTANKLTEISPPHHFASTSVMEECTIPVFPLRLIGACLALTLTKIDFPWISFIPLVNFTPDNSNLL